VIDYLTGGVSGRAGLTLPETFKSSVTAFLGFVATAILLIAILDGTFAYFGTYLQRKVGGEVITGLRSRLFAHVQRLSLRFHYSWRTGEMVNRITSDTSYLETVFSESISAALKGVLQILGMAAVMLWMDWQMMLIALVLAPLLFWVTVVFTKKIKRASRAQRLRQGNLAAIAQETISSIQIVKAYSRESYSDEVFENESWANLQASLAASSVEAKFMPAVQVVTAFGVVVVVCFGVVRVHAGALSPGDLWVFLSYLKVFYRPLKILSKQLRRFVRGQVCWEKISELLHVEDGADERNLKPAPRFKGGIEFRELHFAYTPGQPVLKGLDLRINPGDKVAIVGATGSGKSTLVSLLAKLYRPTRGQILIDGQNIRDFTAASIREQMSFVLQETLLFRTSIRENIAYGRLDASFEEIVKAAKLAKIHDFIESLPDGYDTIVGERGATLSGGQRQRVAIARAILRDAQILILDEPTTGLDPLTAGEVWNELKLLTRNKTTILISHEPGLALEMDRIYRLEHGKVEEVQGLAHSANSHFTYELKVG
ncbi:MAG: ABC transporter ATP-binding protein, partial [Calditrichaeota bacterium]